MPNATVRANAQAMPEANRRALLGGLLVACAFAVAPSRAEADVGVEPELQALIAAWHDASRRLEETYGASCAADERARCPVPQALIATERDARFWSDTVPGRQYQERDVTRFRAWSALSARVRFDEIFSCDGYDDRLAEIIASWDNWQPEREAAKEREGVAEANALWGQAIENYHAMGSRVARHQAKTMADVIAKLLAAAPHLNEDDLEDPTSSAAVLASAALDGLALANARGEEARS